MVLDMVGLRQGPQENGLLRIGDILSWSDVALRPRTRTSLSFGRGYVPLLRVRFVFHNHICTFPF